MKGEKLSNDPEGVSESGICWQSLVNMTLALSTEAEVAGRKEHKERITVLFCFNASGSHWLPLLGIGKSCTPRCLKNLVTPNMNEKRLKIFGSLGVIYTHQNSSWMNKEIFMLW